MYDLKETNHEMLYFYRHILRTDARHKKTDLLECGSNLVSKIKMLDTITNILHNKGMSEDDITINLLLKGNNGLSYEENKQIFAAVHLFIIESKRFAQNDN